ncbi:MULTISPECIES: nucleic acid/nucleotide deaminase domain-containing protein [Corallococcus]|uniref:nucleic acid/nucleotide deaminase domain-containing protein n=1 Tax=Corallococcus TaxID=83461 RepID=UPI001376EC5A|nr:MULTISPECIES: nucleic acid/nucleotide deaminase domain-containing protein [Corallococcus]NBD08472.1 hypothetical protein [Corallococcus silvisoli]
MVLSGGPGDRLDHLLECEGRWAFEEEQRAQESLARATVPVTPRVHGLLDDVAIIFESLYPLADNVCAVGLLAVNWRPTLVVSSNHRLTACALSIHPSGSIRWSVRYSDNDGSLENEGTWSANSPRNYTVAQHFKVSDAKEYHARVAQSLWRLWEAVTAKDLGTIYGSSNVGEARLIRDALKDDVQPVVWEIDWDSHAEIKLLDYTVENGSTWCSRYLGVSKLCCKMCTLYLDAYNTTLPQSAVSFLGSHGFVFKYWKLAPELAGLLNVKLAFERSFARNGVSAFSSTVSTSKGTIINYNCKTVKPLEKQTRRRSIIL